ncbi:MAG: SPOR domain-containing protein [Gammaproteobacteria bacterium]|nr:SPOR domain-containing protein [Gammaproteobacteria bacterium]
MASSTKNTRKRGATPKMTKRKTVPGWLWLATGLLIGLFIAFLVFLRGQSTSGTSSTLKDQLKLEQKEDQQQRAFDYDFYKLLPKLEVVVPEESGKEQDKKTTAKPIATPGVYVLQAGSFKNMADADKRKATLALLGVVSRIVSAKIDGDQIWHRVQIGPFDDLAQLNSTRDLLIDNDIETLLLKVRG